MSDPELEPKLPSEKFRALPPLLSPLNTEKGNALGLKNGGLNQVVVTLGR